MGADFAREVGGPVGSGCWSTSFVELDRQHSNEKGAARFSGQPLLHCSNDDRVETFGCVGADREAKPPLPKNINYLASKWPQATVLL